MKAITKTLTLLTAAAEKIFSFLRVLPIGINFFKNFDSEMQLERAYVRMYVPDAYVYGLLVTREYFAAQYKYPYYFSSLCFVELQLDSDAVNYSDQQCSVFCYFSIDDILCSSSFQAAGMRSSGKPIS